MSEQQPEPGQFEDQREAQGEDGIVVDPGGELEEDLERHDLPTDGDER